MDALMATCRKRSSIAVLEDRAHIVITIQRDTVMRERWDRYSREYTYAHGIEFDEVLEVIRKAITI
jgi:hypothetical protein